jgi:metallo-beta-lactamase family protein
MKGCFDEAALKLVNSGINPLVFPGLKISTGSEDSKQINFIERPKVIISASGMCEAGRIRHHLKHNLWREECTILFVGYQAGGTLGRRILEGEKEVKLFGETIEVRARIESLKGISGHADLDGLLNWLEGFKKTPKRVFVVHGEDTVTEEFARTVEEKFGCPAFAPFPGGEADLITDEILSEGVRIPVKTKKPVQKKADAATERLLSAARWLMEVAAKCEGMANKDKAKFESQILNLADKWEIR